MSPIQHGSAPANANLNLSEADHSFFDDAFHTDVPSSPLPFSADFFPSSSFAAASTLAPVMLPSRLDWTERTGTFTTDAVPETPPGLVVPPPAATAAATIDPLRLALPPSSFEIPSVAWAPSTPGSFVPTAFAPSAFAPSQILSGAPLNTTPGDEFANSQRPSDDVGLGEGWGLDSPAAMPPANIVPEVDDVGTNAPLNLSTTQFPAMEPLRALPVRTAAPAPRRQPNSRQTAKTIAEEVTPEVTANANGVPAKRKPGRPRLPEGAPKARYKKRNMPAPPPTTPPKPKRGYKKRTAVIVDPATTI